MSTLWLDCVLQEFLRVLIQFTFFTDARAARKADEVNGKSSIQIDGPEMLTVDIDTPDPLIDPEEKDQGMAGEDLYLLTPKQGEDRTADGIDTPPEEEAANPAENSVSQPEKESPSPAEATPKGDSRKEEDAQVPPLEPKSIGEPPTKEAADHVAVIAEEGSKEDGERFDSTPEAKGLPVTEEGLADGVRAVHNEDSMEHGEDESGTDSDSKKEEEIAVPTPEAQPPSQESFAGE